MINVLVVDAQVLIRAGLVAMIGATRGLKVAGQAADGQEAVAVAGSTRPDVVLMDLHLPGMGGIAATKRIIAGAAERPPKALILTAVDDEESIFAALRAGASGFLLKDTSPERLMAAIETVANGDMPFSPAVVHRLVDTRLPRPRRSFPHGLEPLTDREQDVLRLVATGLSNTDIAGKLLLSEATIKTHLNRTMRKLGLSNRAQAVMVAYETGLIVPAQLTAV